MEGMTREDEELYDLSDEDLEAAFKEARADEESPDTQIEEDNSDIEDEDIEDNDSDEEEEFDEEESDEDVEELEQPDEDSDDDTSDDDEEDNESEDDSEDEDGDLDGEPDAKDEDQDADEEESEEKPQPVQRRKYKANGQDFEFTDEEIFEQFGRVFGQSMNYTQKMQSIKPWRKTIDAIEEAKLTHNDVNLMIDVLKGDKDAVAAMVKRTCIDTLELDEVDSVGYQPNDYGRNETELAMKDVEDRISKDKEYSITHNVLTKQWDDSSWSEMTKDPSLIELLHTDVKSGMYDIVNPIAQKLKVYDGNTKSDLDYYKQAAGQYFKDQQVADDAAKQADTARLVREQEAEDAKKISDVKAQESKRKTTKKAATKRKAAAPTKSKAGTKKHTDYLDDSDEGFEDWYNKLQDSQ